MTNRIIKSLDCRKIISIFCILKDDFAITVITLFVVFNESFQKALVNKPICVIIIAHLIVLSAIKNPLFDVYFNRITALLAVIFFPVMRTYLGPPALFAGLLLSVLEAYLSPFALFAGLLLSAVRAYLVSFALFAVRFLSVMEAYLSPFALFALIFLPVMGAYLRPFALFAAIFVFSMSAKIFQIFRFSVFANISISFFHFIKQKN